MKEKTNWLRNVGCAVSVLSILLCLLVGCGSPSAPSTARNDSPQGGSAWRALLDDGKANVGNFIMGFAEDDIPVAENVGIRTYSVPAGEPIPMTYHGLSSLPEPVHLRCTLLVDEDQVSFTLDGREALLHDVVLETQVIRDIPIIIPPLDEGAHDLIWLAFWNPDNHSSDEQFRDLSTYAFSDRYTFLAGSQEKWDEIDLVEPLAAFEGVENFPWTAFLSKSAEVLQTWYEETVSADQRLDYYIYTGYEQKTAPLGTVVNEFALLVFLDYKLIPLNVGDDRLRRYFSLGLDTPGTRIAASLIGPQEEGPHELCALRINNPRHTVDELVCEECSPSLSIFPQMRQRTLIQVRE